jgi:amino acid adenylation domain-containing protein/thioester reductase-like protein
MSVSKTVLDYVDERVASIPDAPAVASRQETLTYGELARQSDAVAAYLQDQGIGPGSLVPILSTRTAEFVIGLLGIVKTGAAYVPIDQTYPQGRKDYIIGQTGSPLVLTTETISPDVPATARHGAGIATLRRLPSSARFVPKRRPSPSDPIYVIFTSGTTGVPKGVIIEHRSVAGIMHWHNAHFGVDASSRTTLIAALGFDVAHWEVWSPLCAGARLYLPEESTRRDIPELLKMLEDERITHAFVPTVMAHDVVKAGGAGPSALKYLYTGGEKLNPVNTDHIRYTLIDYYGPTETTIWATFQPVASASLGRPASIGKPVADTQVWILDKNLQEPARGSAGEIFIAGPALARGYLNNDALTAQKFLPHPFEPDQRIYRTGDLGRWLPDGSLQFLGRVDEQVKIRGHLVEVSEIESVIARLPGIGNVSVAAIASADGAYKELVAFLVAEDASASHKDVVGLVRSGVRNFLPDYMIPAHFMVLEQLPSGANGKTDKAALLAMFARDVQQAHLRGAGIVVTETERAVFDAFGEALGHVDFERTDSFFDVGGHSLLAAKVIASLSGRFGMALRTADLYNYATVERLAAEIDQRSGAAAGATDYTPADVLHRDAQLPDDIAFDAPFDKAHAADPAHLLLTGATGFVGVHLLAELLAATQATIHCIVRAKDREQAERRLDDKLREYEVHLPAADKARVSIHAGDLAEADFGLPPADYAALCRDVDVIHHSASAVNFIKPYAVMKKDNVDGLVNILRFASTTRTKALMLLSTISVYSWGHRVTGKTVMREDDDIDQNLESICSDIGYVKSKWVMEKLADAAEARGLPLATFRLGYATYHSETGLSANYQWWGRLVKTCIALGVVPDLHELHEGLTSVDYMTRAIARISTNPQAFGKKFNLIHSGEANVSLRSFFSLLERHFGFEFKIAPFAEWLDLWKDDHTTPLYPVLNLFRDRMHEDKCVMQLYEKTYLWEHSNTTAFLQGTEVRPPTFDERELRRYLESSLGLALA